MLSRGVAPIAAHRWRRNPAAVRVRSPSQRKSGSSFDYRVTLHRHMGCMLPLRQLTSWPEAAAAHADRDHARLRLLAADAASRNAHEFATHAAIKALIELIQLATGASNGWIDRLSLSRSSRAPVVGRDRACPRSEHPGPGGWRGRSTSNALLVVKSAQPPPNGVAGVSVVQPRSAAHLFRRRRSWSAVTTHGQPRSKTQRHQHEAKVLAGASRPGRREATTSA